MKQVLQEQLAKEMTRRQFLQLLVLAIISILGVNNLISLLTGAAKKPSEHKASRGFGSSKFGV